MWQCKDVIDIRHFTSSFHRDICALNVYVVLFQVWLNISGSCLAYLVHSLIHVVPSAVIQLGCVIGVLFTMIGKIFYMFTKK